MRAEIWVICDCNETADGQHYDSLATARLMHSWFSQYGVA